MRLARANCSAKHLVDTCVQEAVEPENAEQLVFLLGSEVGEALAEAVRGPERQRREGRIVKVRASPAAAASRAVAQRDLLGCDASQPDADVVEYPPAELASELDR
jgi:hypothetical protein